MKEKNINIEYIYQNQIDMGKYGLEKNKEFAKKILTNEKINNLLYKNFEKLDKQSFRRQEEPDMNLEKYLSLINENNFCIFKIFLAGHNKLDIRYSASIINRDIQHLVLFECEYNKNNFEIISSLYKEAFGKDITSESNFDRTEKYFTLKNTAILN